MLKNAYFLAKIGADTAENEQHFAEILPKTGNYPTGPVAGGTSWVGGQVAAVHRQVVDRAVMHELHLGVAY